MRARGWDEEIDYIEEFGHPTFFKHKQFRVAEALTEEGERPAHSAVDRSKRRTSSAWDGMRAGMERCMKNIRVLRLEHELNERLRARRAVFKDALLALFTHKQHWPSLRMGDIAFMPEFREVMCAPDDVEVTKDSFDVVAAQMQKYGKELDKRVHNELLGLVSSHVEKKAKSKGVVKDEDAAPKEEKQPSAKVLSLATTCFRCNLCQHRGLFYPYVLKHACLRKHPSASQSSDNYGLFAAPEVSKNWVNEQPIKIVGVLEVREPCYDVAKALKLCGKDAQKVTAKQLDAVPDLRFAVGETTVVTWRAMVRCPAVFGIALHVLTTSTRSLAMAGGTRRRISLISSRAFSHLPKRTSCCWFLTACRKLLTDLGPSSITSLEGICS